MFQNGGVILDDHSTAVWYVMFHVVPYISKLWKLIADK
jgi:hypothetical protein